jgi:hypothetical protein
VSKLILAYFVFGNIWCNQGADTKINFPEKDTVQVSVHSTTQIENIKVKNNTQDKIDSLKIVDFLSRHPDLSIIKNDLLNFYHQRDYSNAWVHGNIIAEYTYALYNKILELIDHGIPYDAPYIDEFKSIFENRNTDDKDYALEEELLISSHYM